MADRAIQTLLGRLLMPEAAKPSILYHYTSMQGLLSIVETGRIRATHVRYLNDQSETSTMWEIVLKRLEDRKLAAKDAAESAILCKLIELGKMRRLSNEFVASFSEKGEDLSQWRSYCSAGGFSIGFSAPALRSQWVSNPTGGSASFVGAFLLKVVYVNAENGTDLDPLIDEGLELGSGLHSSIAYFRERTSKEDVILAWFGLMAPSFKNSAFSAENEWRMILVKPHKPMPGQRFRAGKSTLIPYIEVDLNRDSKFNLSNDYMIRKVVIGPTPNPDLSLESLRSFFLSNGHPEVQVENSVIPYRDW